MKEMKRILSLVLCFMMLVGLMPVYAFAAEGTPVVVIAGSDYQQWGGSNPKDTTQNILAKIKEDCSSAVGFLFGGDYTVSTTSVTDSVNGRNAVDELVTAAGFGIPAANRIYVQGNHDPSGSIGDNKLTATGAHDTDYYGVFSINEDDFASGGSANSDMLTALENYLDTKVDDGYKKPVFVITHLPLHVTTRGDNTSANKIFTLLNEAGASGLNIIFLFGHNHSGGYDAYLGNGSIYLPKGSDITVAGGSTNKLNFTYMNCGYVGYISGSSCAHLTMTTFEIYQDEVIVKRYDANGLHTCGTTANVLKAAGGGTVPSGASLNSTVYTSPQSITLTTPTGGSGDSGNDSTEPETPTTPEDPDVPSGGDGNVYKLDTDGVATGEDYLIVSAGADGKAYALRNNGGSVASAEVTISNGQIVTDAEDIVWTYDENQYLSNNSQYLYLTNGSLSIASSRAMDISRNSAGEGAYTVKRTEYSYYLSYDGGWKYSSSADDVYFFVRTSESGSGGGSETPDTPTTPDAPPTVDTDNKGWITITDGTGKVIYKLDTDGVIDTGVEYLIVDNEEALALSAAASSDNTLTVELDGDHAYTDSEDYGWVFTQSGSNYTIRLNGTTYLGRSNNNLASGSSSSTWSVDHDANGDYYIKQGWYGFTYYLRYTSNGSVFQAGNTQTPVRLYKYESTQSAGDAEYAKLSDNLTATVARGADNYAALEAIKAVVDVLVAHNAEYSDAGAIPDANEDITWALASNYDGNVPGEYAVTISYKGVELGTAKVIVPDTAILCDDVVYYLEGQGPWTTSIGATVTAGTPEGQYTYEILEGGDAIIGSIAADDTITFTGTEGTAQVKITYTYADGDTTATLEKIINVTAKAPYFDVEICDPETNEPITATLALKGVQANETQDFSAVVKKYNEQYPNGNPVENPSLMWSVSNTSIATITADGTLTFTGKSYGTFEVSVYYLDENGNPICEDIITVSATESQYVVPGDGTNDFPEYPEQGAIRFDKTAVAQGNFSQTGIAKVELSMTGVPYGSSVPTDVVIMVDMTTSMYHYGYVDDADAAIKAMLEALVYDAENDKYDPNIYVQVWSFKSDDDGEDVAFVENLSRRNITSPEDLLSAQNSIAFNTDGNDGSGTCYDEGTKKMYEIVNSCTTENVVAVFASDGGPSRYTYLNDNNGPSEISGTNASVGQENWFNNDGSVNDNYLTEYYTYLLKTQSVPVYTVGVGIDANTAEAHVLEHMSSEYDASGKVVSTAPANATTSYFALADINTTPDVLSTVFTGIAASIREAATDVVVEDKIDSHYSVNFSLPSHVTADEAGMSDFYIQVLGYELDENNDRKDNPTVLENFTFSANGALKSHTVNGSVCGETCNHVTSFTGKITKIEGTYFTYTCGPALDENGEEIKNEAGETITEEFLTWTAEKLDRTELALEYFVYLDHSAGENAANQVDPGTYNTNEYATITYKNFNGKECKQEFPVPSMTWMGAKVTYVFYLVNNQGQPVNRAGKVIPFAEAIFVTDPVMVDVHWNELEGAENMLAENLLATAKVPDVYSLYDNQAYYEIRVYQIENENKNYFIIEGSDAVTNKETTKVFNTKAGIRYDDYGAYSATAGEYTSNQSNTKYTATVTNAIDYANTTVAFAVVWKPELTPDTVVVDYGLDVVIDVATNDALASGVTGVSNSAPENVEINKGTYQESAMGKSADLVMNGMVIATAKTENLTSVRFSLNKVNGMQFTEPVDFFYESECNYYKYDNAGNRILNTDFMYSSVTVIPATTIYYEDEYVTLKTHTLDVNDEDQDGDTSEYNEVTGWDTSSVKASAVQQQDRPGESKISADLDADNNYGYDAAYESMSTYSMDHSAMTSVTAGKYATAEFTFYGTGFDVISLTDTTTGTIFVKVADADGNSVKNVMVDTYYGYKYVNGEWVTTTSNDPNVLYQVPVVKVEDLAYGKYTVTITASYVSSFDNVTDSTSYDFYLDAVRIYDPTGNQNDVANDAYVEDGEGWPTYEEVRNNIIDAKTFECIDTEAVNGIVFIDSSAANASVADYTSYGPNNELYLAPGQAINFTLTPGSNVAKVQMALKTVINSANVKIYTVVDGKEGKVLLDQNITTATDMYYTLRETVKDANGNYTQASEMNLVIMNDGTSGVLSITNVKTTYTSDPSAVAAPAMFMLRRSSVNDALATLNVEEEVPETTVPETTVPEVTEPETTVPEETEPETTVPEETEPETTIPEETEPETTEPEETKPSQQEQAEQVIRKVVKIIKGFLGWLFG